MSCIATQGEQSTSSEILALTNLSVLGIGIVRKTGDNTFEIVTVDEFSNESVDDRVATLLQNGGGISWVYNDDAGTITASISGTLNNIGDITHDEPGSASDFTLANLDLDKDIIFTGSDGGTQTTILKLDVSEGQLSGIISATSGILSGSTTVKAFGDTIYVAISGTAGIDADYIGATDTVIQQALDAANTSTTQKIVVCLGGTYTLSSSLNIPNRVKLKGCGKDVTIFDVSGRLTIGINQSQKYFWGLEDLRIKNDNEGGENVIKTADCHLSNVRNVVFEGSPSQIGSITVFADASGGQVTVTSNAHGLEDNEVVVISGTTNYNGTFTITNKTTNTFEITDTWVANDATGTFRHDKILVYYAGPAKIDSTDGVTQYWDNYRVIGTAQAGTASTITLATTGTGEQGTWSKHASNDEYNGMLIYINGGTGQGQYRIITDYNGGTKVATINEAWDTNPDNTSTYEIFLLDNFNNLYDIEVRSFGEDDKLSMSFQNSSVVTGKVSGRTSDYISRNSNWTVIYENTASHAHFISGPVAGGIYHLTATNTTYAGLKILNTDATEHVVSGYYSEGIHVTAVCVNGNERGFHIEDCRNSQFDLTVRECDGHGLYVDTCSSCNFKVNMLNPAQDNTQEAGNIGSGVFLNSNVINCSFEGTCHDTAASPVCDYGFLSFAVSNTGNTIKEFRAIGCDEIGIIVRGDGWNCGNLYAENIGKDGVRLSGARYSNVANIYTTKCSQDGNGNYVGVYLEQSTNHSTNNTICNIYDYEVDTAKTGLIFKCSDSNQNNNMVLHLGGTGQTGGKYNVNGSTTSIYNPRRFTVGSSGGNITIDWGNGEVCVVSGSENITGVTFAGATVGRTYKLILKQAAGANYTIGGWAAAIELAGGAFTWTGVNAAIDIIEFIYENSLYQEISRSQANATP